ncbi:MAG: formylglycine-generating enzyme family protein [Bacteroidales bacterium]|jgi:formylglycine-generating enzyme required for sulfatase activity|nr:formylglycine-generating enzyme family protein [Bacteroidales bacterium]
MRNIFKAFFIGMIAISIVGSYGCSEEETTNETTNIPNTPVINPAEPEMVEVEGGAFMMGCTEEQGACGSDQVPVHLVNISTFKISKYEITQKQWNLIMDTNPSKNLSGDNYPVEMVTYMEAQEFCARLSEETGKQYRLPTEAEWEYAARGGNKSQGYRYSGSGNLDSVAWYNDNGNNQTHPVGEKFPNELGIYDMTGNVWEWCSDWYGAYSSSTQTDPVGPSSGTLRVGRGGSYDNHYSMCGNSYRNDFVPEIRFGTLGFRVVLD